MPEAADSRRAVHCLLKRRLMGMGWWFAFAKSNPVFLASDAEEARISPMWIQFGLDIGQVVRIGPGMYRNATHPLTLVDRLWLVQRRLPRSVFGGLSALHLRGAHREEPEKIWVVLDKKSWAPDLSSLGVEYLMTTRSLVEQDVSTVARDWLRLPVHSIARAVVDLFKYWERSGIDTAVSYLDLAMGSHWVRDRDLLDAARRCRISRFFRQHFAAWEHELEYPDGDSGEAFEKFLATGRAPPRPAGRPPLRKEIVPLIAERAFREGQLSHEVARRLCTPREFARRRAAKRATTTPDGDPK